jgi:DMSO reductase family type II enzyme molybdopterin subunit
MGCQKGACWGQQLGASERVLYPLKRVGERGSGAWERVSWDQALTEIANGIIDALEEVGPEAVFCPSGANALAWGMMAQRRFNSLAGFPLGDFDADIGDCSPGMYLTYGKYVTPSEDDYFHSEVIVMWFANPAYTRIPVYHYLSEVRYNGTETYLVGPDYNPSAMHADYHLPVKPGTDAALCLSMCQVILEEGLCDEAFVREQTDLALLVRRDNRRFLRGSDLSEGGRDDQFYLLDENSSEAVEAPRGTLEIGTVRPALKGEYTVGTADGEVAVTPLMQLLVERLRDYTPERAAVICGVHPDLIRKLARTIASRKTHIYEGLGTGKSYHGDLMGRSMYLALALTGNWGKKGTGPTYWNGGPSTGIYLIEPRQRSGPQEADRLMDSMRQILDALRVEDVSRSDEIAGAELMQRATALMGSYVPPIWWWYYHCGFRDIWNKEDWGDPEMKRRFHEYLQEATDKNWWQGVAVPSEDRPPRVMIEVGGNLLRRTRGGQSMFMENLWPQLKTIVSVDVRMTTTGRHADYVLPAAQQHERPYAHGLAATMFFNVLDKAVEPAGEALPEWQIFRRLAQKLAERGKARGFTEYKDWRGTTFHLDRLEEAFTGDFTMLDEEDLTREAVDDGVRMGVLPEATTLDSLRETGVARIIDWGLFPNALSYATDTSPNETMCPLKNHVEKKEPYPTLTRRAQFYIDHEWFLEADEALPRHKDPPKMGGDYPLMLTSGHNRWSVHGTNIVNRLLLETHRGYPHLVINPADARSREIENDDEVRVYNDMGSFLVRAKVTEVAQPGQVICYTGWDPYQFNGWHGPSDVEGGMVKWLHLAGGYGHLRYWPFMWQPSPADRATRVEVSKSA